LLSSLFRYIYYAPAPNRRGHYAMLLPDVCLSVCLSCTSGLSREQVAHVTRDLDTTFKVKGQGHQAALLSMALMHKAVQRSAWEHNWRCVVGALGRPRGRSGAGHIVSPRAWLVFVTCKPLMALNGVARAELYFRSYLQPLLHLRAPCGLWGCKN